MILGGEYSRGAAAGKDNGGVAGRGDIKRGPGEEGIAGKDNGGVAGRGDIRRGPGGGNSRRTPQVEEILVDEQKSI